MRAYRGRKRHGAARANWPFPCLRRPLTIICSFLPFLILSGATGEFIRALPLTVAIALSTSFLVGMLLTPMLSQFFIKQGLHTHEAATEKKRRSPLEMMQSIYNRVIVVAMRWKTAAIAIGIIAIAVGAFVLHRASGAVLPLRRARPVRHRRLASGRLEGGSDPGCGSAHRGGAAS